MSSETLQRLRELVTRRPPPARQRPIAATRWDYEPWWAQRQFHRPKAYAGAANRFRVLVAGRQTGKTHCAAAELVQIMCAEPGSYSVLLAPTYKIAQAAIDKVMDLCKQLPFEVEWKEQKKTLQFPNGSRWAVFSADRKEAVRGPTINGLLWIDEGAYLHHKAWESAAGALVGNTTARVVITTTPAGRNWVHEEFIDPENDRFRFRSEDSPYSDKAFIAKLRKKMSKEKAQQEFDAVFVENLICAFPPEVVKQLWVSEFPKRKGKATNYIGIDLGKDQDWTVCVLMNQWGDTTVLGRWQKVAWPSTLSRIKELITEHNATAVVDKAYGYGPVVKDFLDEARIPCVMVNTNAAGTKSQIVEQCRADAQWERLSILAGGPNHAQLEDELTKFQAIKRIVKGVEIDIYEAPQIPGEHDDMVIALCLANWGRMHAPKKQDLLSGLESFVKQGKVTKTSQGGFGAVPGSSPIYRRAA